MMPKKKRRNSSPGSCNSVQASKTNEVSVTRKDTSAAAHDPWESGDGLAPPASGPGWQIGWDETPLPHSG